MIQTNKKGFTLLELLVVIAIIAILATAVVLILNPAALFAQARDSQRISDMGTLRTAISLYLSTVTGASLTPDNNRCYVFTPESGSISANCGGRHPGKTTTTVNSMSVGDGLGGSLGYIPVDFGAIPGGSPLSVLPIDPINSTTYFYSYVGNTAFTFEVNADMESARYGGGGDDVEDTDGGTIPTIYEVGNDPGLDL